MSTLRNIFRALFELFVYFVIFTLAVGIVMVMLSEPTSIN